MKTQLAFVLRITDVGTRMTNCDVINIRNTIITSEGTIREIKRSPDTMKAAAILVLGHIHTSKICWDRLLSSALLFEHYYSTAIECRMVVLAKTKSSWPLNP